MQIRAATSNDIALIFSFIQRKADFDRAIGAFTGTLQVSEAKLRRTLFNRDPFAYVLFAELEQRAIGFAFYAFRYSSFVGQPSLWLDDLYVVEAQRSQGAGTALMQHLAKVAQDNDCSHLAWNADARNLRGLQFYQRLGAEITEQHGDRCWLRWVPWLLEP
ncbi:GNAT family N-acetyltransferase [Alkalinema sp. FACHB-956]|uniref:GNAT family N-acetyltransferase n=1 Tax=Alkalinema sp. FACHB-956 TaxID=2692768 RepID=UPI00168988F3|nr:GNAT family N-acetyltransferase [Alkalinema sp. FACHB-956]MBD2326893.1 GNAT family N-acetyltransferase [Alkalinema sp. FACHB-956]